MTSEQQRAAEEFRRLRGVEPFGPFIPLLKSPELMTRVSALGEYLRFRSGLAPRLSELAILITAAHWRQQYEWDVHTPVALITARAWTVNSAPVSASRSTAPPPVAVKHPTWPAVSPGGHGAVARSALPGSHETSSLVKV